MDVLELVREHYDSFNKTQRRIADHLLAHPDVCSFSSLRQMAEATNTTETTLLNFSRKLGFTSFLDMKTHLQGYISQWMSPNEKIRTALADSEASDIYTETIRSDMEALDFTYRSISTADFEKAVSLLKKARRVYIMSHDFPTTLSDNFKSRFIRLGVDVTDLGYMSAPDLLYHLAFCQKQDLLVVFSFAPYSQLPIALAEYFHNQGVPILGFSDSATAPLASFADVLLTSVTKHTLFFNSMTAPISLINLMASVYVSQNKDAFNSYKEDLDRLQRFLMENKVLTAERTDCM